MWLPLLPLLTLIAQPPPVVDAPAVAQARLAQLLSAADSIDAITAGTTATTFSIDRGGEAFELVATMTDTGAISALAVTDAGPAKADRGALTWLASELADTTAITTILAHDGALTLVTGDGRYYRALAGHDPNTAVESRWAAAWDDDATE